MVAGEGIRKFRCGQLIECTVVSKRADGYNVIIGQKQLPGWLASDRELFEGETVVVRFVATKDGQALLQDISNKRNSFARMRDAIKEEQALTNSLKFKRATDLLLPPVDDIEIFTFKGTEFDDLCHQLDDGQFTGCIKAFNENRLSRSGALVYRGRVMGCI